MFINSPNKFAVWFNEKYMGAYRKITAEDVRDMTACRLIGRYRSYSKSLDGETIRGILQYEQLRDKRSAIQTTEDKLESMKSKTCEQPLPPEPEKNKTGRPKEYCSGYESLRNKERKKKSRRQRRQHCKPAIT